MALNSQSSSQLSSISSHFRNPKAPSAANFFMKLASSSDESSKPSVRIAAGAESTPNVRFSARRRESVSVQQLERPLMEYMSLPASQYPVLDAERIERIDDRTFKCYTKKLHHSAGVVSTPKARFSARRRESVSVQQLERPLMEYMSLPASQYSVLDAERIERIDDRTFRCYVYNFKFFAFEVCPVLLVRVEEQPNGCCIKLLSCKLEGSPIVVAQNQKFAASMVNRISCDRDWSNSSIAELSSDTTIEVSIDVPFAFLPIPVQAIESAGTQVLDQILKIMLPRFMAQLVKDYKAWASGDTSRQPLGTGEI